jgi:hypothetical protein
MVILLGKTIIVMGGFVLEASLDEMNNIGISLHIMLSLQIYGMLD